MRGKSFASTADNLPSGLSDHNAEIAPDVVTTLFINYEWRRLISDALQSYADSIIRTLDDALVDDFRNKFQSLLNDLYSVDVMDNTPVGTIAAWVDGNATPAKWIECNDNLYFQDSYPELYALIGDTYDYDNDAPANRFYAPRLMGRFIYGRTANLGEEVGTRGGEATHTLTLAEIPAHNHGIASGNVAGNSTSFLTRSTGASPNTNNSNNAGSGNAHNNLPPFVRLVWMIKALP